MYADNGGIAISGLADGFGQYFEEITSHYQDIINNANALKEDAEKASGAATEIKNLTDKYIALGGEMTKDDADTIKANLKIIGDAVTDYLGKNTRDIIDNLSKRFSDFVEEVGGKAEELRAELYVLNGIGNQVVAKNMAKADEVVSDILQNGSSKEKLLQLEDILNSTVVVDSNTAEKQSFENALAQMYSADINLESPDDVSDAIQKVADKAQTARDSIVQARDLEVANLKNLRDTYANTKDYETGLTIKEMFDNEFGSGHFNEMFDTLIKTYELGYESEINKVESAVGVFAAMLKSKTDEAVFQAYSSTEPTWGNRSAAGWTTWWKGGLTVTPEQRDAVALQYHYDDIKSQYKETYDAINKMASEYNIDVSAFEQDGRDIIAGMANGAIQSAEDFCNALDSVAISGKETVEKTMEIGSPSKVFYEIGSYMMEGWKNGISENQQSVIAVLDTATINILARLAKLKKEFEQYDIGNMRFAGEAHITPTVSFPSSANTGTEPGYAQRNISDMLRNSSGNGNGTGDTVINLQSHTVVELDGEKLGDAVSNHQYRQVRVTNGR